MNEMNVMLGCDPEFFIKKNGKFVCAHGIIPGTKRNPHEIDCGAVQVDGYALEFNTFPARNPEQFCMNVSQVLAVMRKMVDKKYTFALGTPVAHFSPEYMEAQHPEANELGCDPDYNAWSGDVNPRPNGRLPMRTAAGHIHISWIGSTSADEETKRGVCRQMDFFLGLPSVLYDADTERRKLYGKAGAMRYKPYGVEYRTLSNAWLKNKTRMKQVATNAIIGVNEFFNGNIIADKVGDIQEIINTSDKKAAFKIMRDFNIPSIV